MNPNADAKKLQEQFEIWEKIDEISGGKYVVPNFEEKPDPEIREAIRKHRG